MKSFDPKVGPIETNGKKGTTYSPQSLVAIAGAVVWAAGVYDVVFAMNYALGLNVAVAVGAINWAIAKTYSTD